MTACEPDGHRRFGIELHLQRRSLVERLNCDARAAEGGRYLAERLLDQRHDVLRIDIAHMAIVALPGP